MRLFHNKLIIDNCAAFNYGPSIELPENNYSSCAECERVENWLQQVDLNADMIASMDNSNIDYDKTGAADCLCAEYDDLSYSVSMQEFNMSGVVTDNSSLVQNVPECVPYSLTSESDSERQRYISGHDYVSILSGGTSCFFDSEPSID